MTALRNLALMLAIMVPMAMPSVAKADFLHCTFYYDYDYKDPYLKLKIVMSGFDNFYDWAYIHDIKEGTRHKERLTTFDVTKDEDLVYGFWLSEEDRTKTTAITVYSKTIEVDGKEGWKSNMFPPNALETMVVGFCWPEYVD